MLPLLSSVGGAGAGRRSSRAILGPMLRPMVTGIATLRGRATAWRATRAMLRPRDWVSAFTCGRPAETAVTLGRLSPLPPAWEARVDPRRPEAKATAPAMANSAAMRPGRHQSFAPGDDPSLGSRFDQGLYDGARACGGRGTLTPSELVTRAGILRDLLDRPVLRIAAQRAEAFELGEPFRAGGQRFLRDLGHPIANLAKGHRAGLLLERDRHFTGTRKSTIGSRSSPLRTMASRPSESSGRFSLVTRSRPRGPWPARALRSRPRRGGLP